MKKILMMIVMLAMLLPTFGQKLNSRGEKMVSNVYEYGLNKGKLFVRTIYDFEYDSNGLLCSLTCTKGNEKTIIKHNGTTLEGIVWADNKKENNISFEYTMNELGFIKSEKIINYKVDKSVLDYTYNLGEYYYSYNEQLNKYSLVKYSNSRWWAYKGKQPIICYNEYDNQYYAYEGGNPQRIFVVEVDGKEDSRRVSSVQYDGNNINDTNINLCALIPTFCLANNILAITEWVPFNTNILPTGGTAVVYDYYDGCVVGMSVGSTFYNGSYYPYSVIKICYVEDDDE